ncbi:hypothetical protein KUV22_17170 [Microbulbifer agarilyticus]|uniref:hypothetical protein n=1 Tax=Microbulbifer agarilyticus TaxID=260552 RepID=UPI001C96BDF7|nr:hypothetical protein [Microbulbifer agarilyticus]MBY6192153.1 hypothetical protein [Microbulbifer agarilyticus]
MSFGEKSIQGATILLIMLSAWATYQGIRFESYNYIGTAAYLSLAFFVYRRNNNARYVSFAVLLVHGAMTFFVIAMTLSLKQPTPDEIQAMSNGAHSVFTLEVNVKQVLLRESAIFAGIVASIILLANKHAASLFETRA